MRDHQATGALTPTTQHRGDVRAALEPIVPARDGVHAESFARPRRRRLLRTRRPARVCIRERNPCLRERRRLLGW